MTFKLIGKYDTRSTTPRKSKTSGRLIDVLKLPINFCLWLSCLGIHKSSEKLSKMWENHETLRNLFSFLCWSFWWIEETNIEMKFVLMFSFPPESFQLFDVCFSTARRVTRRLINKQSWQGIFSWNSLTIKRKEESRSEAYEIELRSRSDYCWFKKKSRRRWNRSYLECSRETKETWSKGIPAAKFRTHDYDRHYEAEDVQHPMLYGGFVVGMQKWFVVAEKTALVGFAN
jgi:hypothetical protein